MSAKTIYVYENWSSAMPVPMGRIYLEILRGKESCSFEYEPAWLAAHAGKTFLDPELQLYQGRQYAPMNKELFGIFADSCPDRWGRLLMRRRQITHAIHCMIRSFPAVSLQCSLTVKPVRLQLYIPLRCFLFCYMLQ